MPRKLTESLEDYLEAIAELIEIEGHAHTKEIAQKLHVKMPSVTGALRQLEQLGYIIYNTHYPVQLTPAGKEIADKVVLRHMVLKKFFADILGLTAEKASETACRLEHAVDEDTIERFILFSEAIELRSDAKPIQTYLTEAMNILAKGSLKEICVLSKLQPGEKGTIEHFGRNIADPDSLELKTGDHILLDHISLDKTTFYIRLDSAQERPISLPIAENLWIRKS